MDLPANIVDRETILIIIVLSHTATRMTRIAQLILHFLLGNT